MPSIGAAWRAVRDRFRAGDIDTPELDARLLAEAAFELGRLELSLREEEAASSDGLAQLNGFADRRLDGEPVARILGHKEFYGLDFELNGATLVPRPETEMLVEEAIAAVEGVSEPVLLDLGTGSGCIVIAVLKHVERARAIAVDLSAKAIAMATRNAERHGVADRLQLRVGSWCEPLTPGETFDVVVSNPPYVESDIIGELSLEVGQFDPKLALDGGEDGLGAYRAITACLGGRVKPGGTVLVEIGSEQGFEVGALISAAGFSQIDIKKDLAGLDRLVVGHQIS